MIWQLRSWGSAGNRTDTAAYQEHMLIEYVLAESGRLDQPPRYEPVRRRERRIHRLGNAEDDRHRLHAAIEFAELRPGRAPNGLQ